MNDGYLQHHGVKGQKWGIRRTPAQLGRKVQKLEKKNAQTEEKINKLENKRVKQDAKALKREKRMIKVYSGPGPASGGHHRSAATRYARAKRKVHQTDKKIQKAKNLMFKNGKLIDSYNKTIDSLEKGDIESGNRFVDKFLMQYEN